MTTRVHAQALVDSGATLGEDVEVGPGAIIDAQVRIGNRSVIGPYAILRGPLIMGEDNRVLPFSVIGEAPPGVDSEGACGSLEIGSGNAIREGVTIHRGTKAGGGVTRIGDHNLLMAQAHVAHDCLLGDHIVMANNASLAGHVRVGDHANLGGYAQVPQGRSLGESAMVTSLSLVLKDVPAFVLADGRPAVAMGLNVVGLHRRGISEKSIDLLREAYAMVFRRAEPLPGAIARLADLASVNESSLLRAFLGSIRASEKGILRSGSWGRSR